MGCLAILLSLPLLGGTVAAFANGYWVLGILGVVALWAVWWVAGSLHNRGLVAQGIRGEVGTRALEPLPEWRRALESRDYPHAARISRSMVAAARNSRRFEGDGTTLGHLLNLHIGTLHLEGVYDEKYAAVEELMALIQPDQKHQLSAALAQMFNEDDDLLSFHLLEASRLLFPNTP